MEPYEYAVLALAAFATSIPTIFIHWSAAKVIGKGVVQSGFGTKSIVTKGRGVKLLFVDAVFWVLILLGLNVWLEGVFRNHLDRLPFGFFAVLPGLYISLRIKAGGKYSLREKITYPPAIIIVVALFLYSIGFTFQAPDILITP